MPSKPQGHICVKCGASSICRYDRRIGSEAENKSALKKFTENAGAVALVLGLILTVFSLYDAFITEPKADRIASITQFNQAVSSAAKLRQDLAQMQSSVTDSGIRLAIMSAAMPQVLSNISTARAILPSLRDTDVGTPQLIVLISEAFTAGDVDSARQFVSRAVNKIDEPAAIRAEAHRYQAKFLFYTGDLEQARNAFREALRLLGNSPITAPARAYDLVDWAMLEVQMGDCNSAKLVNEELTTTLDSGGVSLEAWHLLTQALHSQLAQFPKRCDELKNVGAVPSSAYLLAPGGVARQGK